jgi:phage baseplate assembly protein W
MARADRFTEKSVTPVVDTYSDFDINLSKNPITGALARLTEEDAVRRSVYNLVRTINGERPFQTRIGSQVWNSLFEPDDLTSAQMLQDTTRETLERNEPRVRVIQVVLRRPHADTFTIDIYGALVNTGKEITISVPFLRRVR